MQHHEVQPGQHVLFAALGHMAHLVGNQAADGVKGAFAVGAVSAQTWPAGRTVSIINPAAPGGSSDPLARIAAEILTNAYGGSFIVENRQGANGNIGAAYVAKAQPDGYTLLMSWTGTLVSAVTMYGSKPFNPMTDFEPIVLIGSIPNVITVDAKLPIRNLTELTEYARKHPGEINFGSTGSGSSWHLAAELYKKVLGVQMTHVPYTSPAAVTKDLVGGQLQAVFPGTMAIASLTAPWFAASHARARLRSSSSARNGRWTFSSAVSTSAAAAVEPRMARAVA